MGLSILGIFHTIIGVIAISAAILSFVKKGKIDLDLNSGKIYFYFTLITSFTALGLSSIPGFNPGHILALLVIILVVVAFFLHVKKTANPKTRYIENLFLSFSFFLSMIPTVNETFTRVPLGHPLASGPQDPLIGKSILVLFLFFVLGSIFQWWQQYKFNKEQR